MAAFHTQITITLWFPKHEMSFLCTEQYFGTK